MKFSIFIIFISLFSAAAYSQVDTTANHFWMMTYFQNASDAAGAYIAFSSDTTGINWQYYNNDEVFIVPITVAGANDHKMRDPMMMYDSVNNKFTLVWTVSWTGQTIGWDTSSNLAIGTWGPQMGLQVGSTIPTCYVCWAPEIFWDDVAGQWEILWSTCQGSSGDKHTYYVHVNGPIGSMDSSAATGYSAPTLMFNPGFTVIDADIIKVATSKYCMVFKDERVSSGSLVAKNIHYVLSSQPTGPWKGPNIDGIMSMALTTTGCEGPSIVKQGGAYHLFFDPYAASPAYRLVISKVLGDSASPWQNGGVLKAGTTYFTYNHSNVIEIPRRYVMALLYNQPLPTPPSAPALTFPTNGATTAYAAPQMNWTNVPGATGYNVQVSTSSNFAAIAQGNGVSSDSATFNLNAYTTYYWRVNASTTAAGAGTWSGVWSFTTMNSATLPVKRAIAPQVDLRVANNTLIYSVKNPGLVQISFKDMLGRTTVVLSQKQAAGHYTVGLQNYKLAAGRYIVSLKTAGVEKSAALVVSK